MLQLADRITEPKKPAPGEETALQGGTSFAMSQLPGFTAPESGTFETYDKMSGHPNLALAYAVITGPILAGSWSFEAEDGAKDEWVDFIQSMFEPMRPSILNETCRALRSGCRLFEKVYEADGTRLALRKLKALTLKNTDIRVDEHGAFVGLRQGKVELPPLKSFVYTYDGECGNLWGRSRHENVREIWSKWMQVDERGGQLATKSASIIPMVHYPMGSSKDESGSDISNFKQAQRILGALGTGKGVALPNLFINSSDSRLSAELAGKSAWVISFLEATGAASNMSGMTDKQRYYDSLMLRGWLVPERAVTEGQSGTKAEAEEHGKVTLKGSELLDQDIARQINWYVIDDLLALNFGEAARGMVKIQPSPLIDEKKVIFQKIMDAVLDNPGTLEELLTQADVDAIFDVMEIPKKGNKVIDFAPTTTPDPKEDDQLPPDAKVGLTKLYKQTQSQRKESTHE